MADAVCRCPQSLVAAGRERPSAKPYLTGSATPLFLHEPRPRAVADRHRELEAPLQNRAPARFFGLSAASLASEVVACFQHLAGWSHPIGSRAEIYLALGADEEPLYAFGRLRPSLRIWREPVAWLGSWPSFSGLTQGSGENLALGRLSGAVFCGAQPLRRRKGLTRSPAFRLPPFEPPLTSYTARPHP